MIEINLNDPIKFKPKDKARQILKKEQPSVLEKMDEDGLCEMQLHAFISVIGPHIQFGKDLPIETILYFQQNNNESDLNDKLNTALKVAMENARERGMKLNHIDYWQMAVSLVGTIK